VEELVVLGGLVLVDEVDSLDEEGGFVDGVDEDEKAEEEGAVDEEDTFEAVGDGFVYERELLVWRGMVRV
jgi:hypothetical protein